MQQLKSISEDHRRHQDILEQRKKEILGLKKETENEENNRESYLASVEKNLERELRNRQQMRLGNLESCSSGGAITDEVRNPDHCELTSVDEYSLYGGNAPHSRGGTSSKRGATRGRKKKPTLQGGRLPFCSDHTKPKGSWHGFASGVTGRRQLRPREFLACVAPPVLHDKGAGGSCQP